ncbi:class I SAM-dependent methyltransferase [Methylobacterium sp. E-016]|uniref:class I SAM-dependent methyltransferase n=1 Tax=Methylobacterium sp. E-016 TaxID=2836556 RepID=UPI001FBBC9D9|nr:class I SAM-dependent methyltransferase [Methylobacterium sp. E-016]MCJ2078269.1 class I SAM-dependent methyltransferase [Methylobacterium sp. E-016]
MAVFVCSQCGLTQSGFQPYARDRRQTLSADADWGNVRHGKGLRLQAVRGLVEGLDLSRVSDILDVGSNRGDFVRWVQQRHPHAAIWAVEPDERIIDYRHSPGVNYRKGKLEDSDLPQEKFGFVYNCQTLEHSNSAVAMLQTIWRAMRPGALMLLDVPNISSIGHSDIVEEFFIDKHVFHFDPSSLRRLVEAAGFEIVSPRGGEDPFNITLFARKIEMMPEPSGYGQGTPPLDNAALIRAYADTLHRNRERLARLVETKLRPLAKRQRVAYWGAGRIFDALVKYGGLTSSDLHLLVDKYLAGLMPETHGIPIQRPETLRLHEPQVVIVLARSGESAIASRAYAMGIRHVLKFSELLEQVTDIAVTPAAIDL